MSSHASGWFPVDRDGWWTNTVSGFEAEGIPVYEPDDVTFTEEFEQFVADVLGFADAESLEAYIRGEQFASIDKNQDDVVCMRSIPGRGALAYLFGAMDNHVNAVK